MQGLLEWEPDRWHDHINYSCLAAEVRQALRKHIDYWAKVQGPGIRKSLVIIFKIWLFWVPDILTSAGYKNFP